MSKRSGSKNSFYLAILNLVKSDNSNLQKIKKELGISKQRLNYYIRQLVSRGCLKKISKGNYLVKHLDLEHAFHSTKKECRGHAFIWNIKLNRKYNWKQKLEQNRISYQLLRNIIPRIIINNKKVWLGKKTITIYESHSFYGKNSLESRKYAIIDLLETIQSIELKLSINLKPYIFKPSREHYGLIRNDLAQQYNRKKEKLFIRDDLEGEWLWIDDSESLGELETKNIIRSKQVQDWWNDNKKYDFKVTPTFLMESINKITQNQSIFDANIVKHQEVLNEMSETLKTIRDVLTKKR